MAEEAILTSSQPKPVPTSALAGVSRNDLAIAGELDDQPAPPSASAIADGLKAAQEQDRSKKAAATPGAEPKAPQSDAPSQDPPTPKGVPGVGDWKPKGESAKQWEQLKQSHASEKAKLAAELESLKSRLSTFESAGVTEDALKSLQAERDQYRETLRDVAIDRDPEFNKPFKARQDAAIAQAKLSAGDSAAKLEELLRLPSSPLRDDQISSLMDNLPEASKRRINGVLSVLEQIDVERASAIGARRLTYEQNLVQTQKQAEEHKRKTLEQASKVFKSEFDRWTDPVEGNPFLREREGDAAGNAETQKALDVARSLHESYTKGEWTHEDVAKAILHVAASSRAAKTAMDAIARAEKAEAALDRMRGTAPGVGQSAQPQAQNSDDSPPPGTEAYATWFANQIRQRQAVDRQKKFTI